MEEFVNERKAIRAGLIAKLQSKEWRLVEEDKAMGFVLESLTTQDPTPAFRATFVVTNTNVEAIVAAMHEYSLRLQWDPSLHSDSRSIRKVADQATLDVSVSQPALAGAISSREFADVRVVEPQADGSVLYYSGSVECDHKPQNKRVLGHNFPCGMRCEPDGAGGVRVCMVWHSKLGGWLPHSLVSQAMPGAMKECAQNLRKYIART